MITTLNEVGRLWRPESISGERYIGTQFLPLSSSAGNWVFSEFAPRENSDLHRGQEYFGHRASCVSTQRAANEINSVMVLRSSFSLTRARWASTVLVLKWSSSAIWTVLLPRPINRKTSHSRSLSRSMGEASVRLPTAYSRIRADILSLR